MPSWVFCAREGHPIPYRTAQRAFKRLLQAAGLPGHFTLHSFRHTVASLLLQKGESPVYVSRLLGHTTIKLTCDLYGRWLPIQAIQGGVNSLNGPVHNPAPGESGSKW